MTPSWDDFEQVDGDEVYVGNVRPRVFACGDLRAHVYPDGETYYKDAYCTRGRVVHADATSAASALIESGYAEVLS